LTISAPWISIEHTMYSKYLKATDKNIEFLLAVDKYRSVTLT